MTDKNFSYTIPDGPYKGKTLWSGRYCAVIAIVVVDKDVPNVGKKRFVLVSRRGPGCPNYVGKWNIQCGFLENTESGEQGCSRETYEEVGIRIPSEDFKLFEVTTDPNIDKNVCLRYIARYNEFPKSEGYKTVDGVFDTERGGEANEVEECQWLDLDNIDKFEWAFNHKELLYKIKNLK